MTATADIISEAMLYIDDIRLQEQLAINPALFYRRMSMYVTAAMPLLSSPPQLFEYISGKYTEAVYEDYAWTSTVDSTMETTTLDTQCVGYDLFSVVAYDCDGNAKPYDLAVYDKDTGEITFPVQPEANIEYEIDFYTDGEVADLSLTMKRLFGLAIAIVWDERFSRNWLNITTKIKDSSFQTVNESTYIDKITIRMKENRQALQDELRKYEQNTAYNTVVSPYNYNHRMNLI